MTFSIGRMLVLGAAALSALAAMSAQAQPLGPSGEWEYTQDAEACRAHLAFGGDGGAVFLRLRSFGPGSPIEVTVGSPNLPKEPLSARLSEIAWDGVELKRDQIAVLSSLGGMPTATVLMSHRPTMAFFKGRVDRTLYAATELQTSARTLQLRVVGASVITLDTGSLQEPLARLAECEGALLAKWGWGSAYAQTIATEPTMLDRDNFSALIAYPPGAVIGRVSAITELRLKIDAAGKVAECVVQSPAGNSRFGSDSCKTIQRQVRYTPARNHQGEAVPSFAQVAIAFGILN